MIASRIRFGEKPAGRASAAASPRRRPRRSRCREPLSSTATDIASTIRSAIWGAPVPITWISTTATARPSTTPATRCSARWRCAPWVAPIATTVAMQAKIGCGSGSSSTHRYHAASAATAVCRIAWVRDAQAAAGEAEGSHTYYSCPSAACHSVPQVRDLRCALSRHRHEVSAGPEPGLPAAAVHRRRLPRAGVGLDVAGGAVVSGSFQAYDQTYLVDALQRLGDGFVGVAKVPRGHHRRRGAGAATRPACARAARTSTAARDFDFVAARTARRTSSRAGTSRSTRDPTDSRGCAPFRGS